MARIPQDQLDRLKRDIDLVALARSRGVPLEAKGSDFLGLCLSPAKTSSAGFRGTKPPNEAPGSPK